MTFTRTPNAGVAAIGQPEPPRLALAGSIGGMEKGVTKKRKALSKKIRFEVFKRDSFSCQYCGAKAPDVILHVDHIDPVSKGGGNEIINLITSCVECNSGKGARTLDDQTTLAKQRAQLEDLNDRREQLEQMLRWREGMKSVDDMTLEAAIDHFRETYSGWLITSDGAVAKVRALVKEFGLNIVMDAMEAGADTYCKGEFTEDAVTTAFSKLGGICHNLKNPDERGIRYARGIIRNRLGYIHEGIAISLLRTAKQAGVDDEDLKALALEAGSWTAWRDGMDYLISDMEG